MHWPIEFFHLHAGNADYFHHGGKRFQKVWFATYEMDEMIVKLVDWNFQSLDVRNMI